MMAVSWLKEQRFYLILLEIPGIHDVCEAAVLIEGEQVCGPIAKLDAAACAQPGLLPSGLQLGHPLHNPTDTPVSLNVSRSCCTHTHKNRSISWQELKHKLLSVPLSWPYPTAQ
jgi:hypothetical protein